MTGRHRAARRADGVLRRAALGGLALAGVAALVAAVTGPDATTSASLHDVETVRVGLVAGAGEQPASEPAPDPAEPAPPTTREPAATPGGAATAEPAPTPEPAPEPATDCTSEPTDQTADQPTDQTADQPTDQPTDQPGPAPTTPQERPACG